VVVHLAWQIQPSRDEAQTERTNVEGSRRVFEAAAAAGVKRIVYASSIGAYSPGPQDRIVDESHPHGGIPSSFYSRHKAAVEDLLDDFESRYEDIAVVRMRPALIFKGEAGSEIRRLFAGPFLPTRLVSPALIPLVPDIDGLRFQAVHTDDVAQAYRLAATGEASGAFNIAADPVLDAGRLQELLKARPLPVPSRPVRALAWLTWKARLQPTPPGWLDMALGVPLLDSSRAREELGWAPRHTSEEALLELIEGIRERRGAQTPPLDPASGGPLRLREFWTGVGGRSF
jgi:nucleoside-diphosphate-sugar epimerase